MIGDNQQTRDLEVLIEAYKVADANHRFYVGKRFTIISFYLPIVTAAFSAGYFLLSSYERLWVAVLAFVVTLLLYALESRNWILSNVCLNRARSIASEMAGRSDEAVGRELALHDDLADSYKSPLGAGATWLDAVVRRVADSQHKAICWFSVLLMACWLGLGVWALARITT